MSPDGAVDLFSAAPSARPWWAAMVTLVVVSFAGLVVVSPVVAVVGLAAEMALGYLRQRQLAPVLAAQFAHARAAGRMDVRVLGPFGRRLFAHRSATAVVQLRGGQLSVSGHLAAVPLDRLQVSVSGSVVNLSAQGYDLRLDLFYHEDPAMLWPAPLARQLYDALVALGVPAAGS